MTFSTTKPSINDIQHNDTTLSTNAIQHNDTTLSINAIQHNDTKPQHNDTSRVTLSDKCCYADLFLL